MLHQMILAEDRKRIVDMHCLDVLRADNPVEKRAAWNKVIHHFRVSTFIQQDDAGIVGSNIYWLVEKKAQRATWYVVLRGTIEGIQRNRYAVSSNGHKRIVCENQVLAIEKVKHRV